MFTWFYRKNAGKTIELIQMEQLPEGKIPHNQLGELRVTLDQWAHRMICSEKTGDTLLHQMVYLFCEKKQSPLPVNDGSLLVDIEKLIAINPLYLLRTEDTGYTPAHIAAIMNDKEMFDFLEAMRIKYCRNSPYPKDAFLMEPAEYFIKNSLRIK